METILIVKIRVISGVHNLENVGNSLVKLGNQGLKECLTHLILSFLNHSPAIKWLIKKCCLPSLKLVVWNRAKEGIMVTLFFALLKMYL